LPPENLNITFFGRAIVRPFLDVNNFVGLFNAKKDSVVNKVKVFEAELLPSPNYLFSLSTLSESLTLLAGDSSGREGKSNEVR